MILPTFQRKLKSLFFRSKALAVSVLPPEGEFASEWSALLSAWDLPVYSPDTLVQSRPEGLKVYAKMTGDPYVETALRDLKAGVLSRPWTLEAWSESPEDREARDFAAWILENLGGENRRGFHFNSFPLALNALLSCLDFGFSLGELLWEPMDTPYGRRLGIRDIKVRSPWNFRFDLDEFGNLKPDGLLLALPGQEAKRLALRGKFVVFPYLGRFGTWVYGASELRRAYRAYYLIDLVWRLRGVYLQKFAGGVKVGKYPRSASAQERQDFKDQLSRLTQEGVLMMPENFTLEAVSIASMGEDQYQIALQDLKKEVSLALTGQTLASDEGATSGSRAAAQVHADTRATRIDFLANLLETVMTSQVIRPLIEANFPSAHPPAFHLRQPEVKDTQGLLAVYRGLVEMGVPVALADVYADMGIRSPDEEELAQGKVLSRPPFANA